MGWLVKGLAGRREDKVQNPIASHCGDALALAQTNLAIVGLSWLRTAVSTVCSFVGAETIKQTLAAVCGAQVHNQARISVCELFSRDRLAETQQRAAG